MHSFELENNLSPPIDNELMEPDTPLPTAAVSGRAEVLGNADKVSGALGSPSLSSVNQTAPRPSRPLSFIALLIIVPVVLIIVVEAIIISSMLYGFAIATIGFVSAMTLIQIVHATYPVALAYLPPITVASGDLWLYQRDGIVGAAVFGAVQGLSLVIFAAARRIHQNVAARRKRHLVLALDAEPEGRQNRLPAKMLHKMACIICASIILPVGSLIITAWSGGEKDAVASNMWFTATVNVLGAAFGCLAGGLVQGLVQNKVVADGAENKTVTDAKEKNAALSTMV